MLSIPAPFGAGGLVGLKTGRLKYMRMKLWGRIGEKIGSTFLRKVGAVLGLYLIYTGRVFLLRVEGEAGLRTFGVQMQSILVSTEQKKGGRGKKVMVKVKGL